VIDQSASSVRLRAPAKLNLGLAITGRRDDGFHDLVTIFQAIDLCDDVTVRHRPTGETPALVHLGEIGGSEPGEDAVLVSDDNLAVRAARAAADATGLTGELTVSLDKAIPPASGMGGASSDAAAALSAIERIAGRAIPDPDRLRIELALGSDVPFFRRAGTALAGGRGEDLDVLPTPREGVFVVVVPRLSTPILRKTATLFGALRPDDFDAGHPVLEQAGRLRRREPIDPDLLDNGFERALGEIAPEVEVFRRALHAVAPRRWALSGAGPTHYGVDEDPERAADVARRLGKRFGPRAMVAVCRPWSPDEPS
jgi:4-diphosphocytidyl-2-C-methyl-D-erythritol kinase